MEPYKITMDRTQFGNYTVEVMHDLAWAVLWINEKQYEAPGNTDGFWMNTYDEKGSMTTPLQRVLQMIRLNRNPDKCLKDELSGFDQWLKGEGGPLVAAWREAHARAKYFWEHPADLSEACLKEVINRWRGERFEYRKHVLQTFIPEEERARLGIRAVDYQEIPF